MGKRYTKRRTVTNLLFVIICFSFTVPLIGQIGGRYVYEFLGLPASARLSALGGHLISVSDDDVNLAMSNPASLNDKTHNSVAFNHNFHFAGISNGHAAIGRKIDKWGIHSHLAFSYISYGDFVLADVYGNDQGDFSGSENSITLGASKQLNEKIIFGANLKGVFGRYETYSSAGIAADLGLNYIYKKDKIILSFVVKNLGTELSTFRDNRHLAPLDIQIGISNRLQHLPFRFSIIAHQLQQWNIRYDDPTEIENTNIFGDANEKSAFSKNVDNLFRHLIFNGEFLLGKKENLRIRFGYNHLRRKELTVSEFRSLAGFSLGFGIKISKFRLDYGIGYHHLAGAVNHLSISTNLNSFKKKDLIE